MADGFWNFPFLRRRESELKAPVPMTAIPAVLDPNDSAVTGTFNDSTMTTSINAGGYDFDAILRDKEGHIHDIYMIADYYVDQDPLIRGIVKEVYTPFSVAGKWRLTGVDERTKKAFMEYYERIDLNAFMYSVFLQYYKYANVFPYLMDDGRLKTMPVINTRIGNITVGNHPLVEYNCRKIIDDFKESGIISEKGYVDDDKLSVRLAGFPQEIVAGVRNNQDWVQLNPLRCMPIQDLTEDWTRYAYPFITACFSSLQKKALISAYEDATLKLGAHGFVHTQYGDPNNVILPDKVQLTQVNNLVASAMKNTSLATTNNWAEIKFIQADMRYLYEYDKYKDVNNDILSAGGISGIIVSGVAHDGSTFASAQVSLQTAEKRIAQARIKFERMMYEINKAIIQAGFIKANKVPHFKFDPLDLQNNTRFQDTCLKLWEKGAVSTRTALESTGFDFGQEIERINKEQEIKKNVPISVPLNQQNEESDGEGSVGRPEMDDSQTDKSKSLSGKLPKPSNPNGSL